MKRYNTRCKIKSVGRYIKNSKIVQLNPILLLVTLNVHRLNTSIKKQIFMRLD